MLHRPFKLRADYWEKRKESDSGYVRQICLMRELHNAYTLRAHVAKGMFCDYGLDIQ
jgi:hypothetical protein